MLIKVAILMLVGMQRGMGLILRRTGRLIFRIFPKVKVTPS
jgi:hypothetical protein